MLSDQDRLICIQDRAEQLSTCCKVAVGAAVYNPLGQRLSFGFNMSMPDNCKEKGCHRINVYGEDSDSHRLPSDCYALHAEIHALMLAARLGHCTNHCTLYVSRYPCEACARAIVAAGVDKVIYSGKQSISEQTAQILKPVEVIHIPVEVTYVGGESDE